MFTVCHMTSVHSQKDIRIFEKECSALVEVGYEVHLVAPGKNGKDNGVHIHGVGDRPKSRLKRIFLFSRLVYREALKVDAQIYHFHDPELIPYGLKLQRKGKKIIFDSHENVLEYLTEKTYIPRLIRMICGKAFLSYIKFSCSKFECIISVDPIICNNYKQINKNVKMIANYPVVDKSNMYENEFLKEQKYIAFAGGIDSQWNHDTIINAIENIEGIKYILCGTAENKYLEYLKTLPGWKKVEFRGKVAHKEALNILHSSIAGVALCSSSNNTNGKKGTLGNTKLFEIMMSTVPVICTSFNSWKKIIEENQCGICVDPRNTVAVKEAIQAILDNPRKAQEMGKRGKKIVIEKYNWENEKRKLCDLYADLQYGSLKDNRAQRI